MLDPVPDPVLVAVGLVLLTVGGDRFVIGAARLSVASAVNPVIVGAVVIGFGTSLPEFVVTALAAIQGSQDVALGNVVGSNIANVLLVLGTAAAIRSLAARPQTLRRELPLMLGAVGLLAVLTLDAEVSAWDALALLVAAAVFLGALTRWALADREAREEMSREVEAYASTRVRVLPALLLALAGLAAVLVGAQLLVDGAVGLARAVGVSELVIGITVVAVGTSLPELVTAVAAARRGETDLIIGNVLGSNLFNALPVAGVAGLLHTAPLAEGYLVNVGVMVVACAVAAVLLGSGRVLRRIEGVALLGLFVVAVTVAVRVG